MNILIRGLKITSVSLQPIRYKKNAKHWTNIENKRFPRFVALSHFDDFYKSVFGAKLWRSLRLGLLCNNKYCAVVNNYSTPEIIIKSLEDRGALNLRILYEMQRDTLIKSGSYETDDDFSSTVRELESKIDSVIMKKAKNDKLSNIYGRYEKGVDEEVKKFLMENEEEKPPVEVLTGQLSLTEGLKNAHIDHSRIVDPKRSVTLSTLYEFLPATKLKGMDEWITEEQHYEYYRKSLDFPINVEIEEHLKFPEYLNIYTYEKCNVTSFIRPTIGRNGVFDYYLLDGGSILPVLALSIEKGDRVLDMCGAPGGKAITTVQTLLPDEVVCNDKYESRVNRIKKVANEYLYDLSGCTKFSVTCSNAVDITKEEYYNKILVDVPCTNDRVSVRQDRNNYFLSSRTKERLCLPEIQCELLAAALRLVTVDGCVVYSTCSLSPIQNDGVVQMALKSVWNESTSEFVVKDLSRVFKPLDIIYCLGTNVGMKYGILVLPNLTANFGPIYISKIQRVH